MRIRGLASIGVTQCTFIASDVRFGAGSVDYSTVPTDLMLLTLCFLSTSSPQSGWLLHWNKLETMMRPCMPHGEL